MRDQVIPPGKNPRVVVVRPSNLNLGLQLTNRINRNGQKPPLGKNPRIIVVRPSNFNLGLKLTNRVIRINSR